MNQHQAGVRQREDIGDEMPIDRRDEQTGTKEVRYRIAKARYKLRHPHKQREMSPLIRKRRQCWEEEYVRNHFEYEPQQIRHSSRLFSFSFDFCFEFLVTNGIYLWYLSRHETEPQTPNS